MFRAWLEVDLKKLKENLAISRLLSGDKDILGVVKSNGYGCGSIKIAEELKKNGVNILSVATLDEGMKLRKYGIKGEILIFGALLHEEYKLAFSENLQITVSSYEDIEYIEKNYFINPKVHIKIDTGMGRIGFQEFRVKDLNLLLEKCVKTEILGIYSHFSCSDVHEEDAYTKKQIEKFKEFENLEKIKYRHIQNSAGIISYNNLCSGNLVRPGIMLYGFTNLCPELQPITSLKSRIVHTKIANEDMFISYCKEGFVKKGGMIGTVSIGYADGYQRRFSSNGIMYVLGVPCKVIGKVCMDITMIEIPEKLHGKVEMGTEVDVFSSENNRDIFNELEIAGISPYEYLVGITDRVHRVYKD